MTQETTQPDYQRAMVLYCDGSCRPNPGPIGFGFHGYKYDLSETKKSSLPAGYKLTTGGYVAESDITPETKIVTPVMYFDAVGCSKLVASNNKAEILAASSAMATASQHDIQHLTLKTDSMYVINGLLDYSHAWVRNRWIKADGTPVPNQVEWRELLANVNTLTEKGVQFDIKWVKGHADILGNEVADARAKTGSNYSAIGAHPSYDFQSTDHHTIAIERPAQGYWSQDSNRHPLLSWSRYYFNTLKRSHEPGEYFISTMGSTDDGDTGKFSAEDAYGVVQLSQPCEVMELIRGYQTQMSGDLDATVMVRLDALFGKTREHELKTFGIGALLRVNYKKLDLKFTDDEPITKEFKPLRRADYAMQWISVLKSILLQYKAGKTDDYAITDVTDLLYETAEKKKKTLVQLKPEINVGYKVLKATVQTKKTPIDLRLSLGLDLPDRNSLKKLEGEKTKVLVLVWHQSPQAVRYACIVTNGDDYGIYAAFHANQVILP